jgi:hypothetical protein
MMVKSCGGRSTRLFRGEVQVNKLLQMQADSAVRSRRRPEQGHLMLAKRAHKLHVE